MDPKTLQAAPSRLTTSRLDLFWPHLRHAAAVRESINASLETLRFVKWGQRPFDEDDAKRFCEADAAQVAAGDCLIYFAFERSSGRFVGNLDLHTFDFDVPCCQIGYVGDTRLAGVRSVPASIAITLLTAASEVCQDPAKVTARFRKPLLRFLPAASGSAHDDSHLQRAA